jgi:hypothetical protein
MSATLTNDLHSSQQTTPLAHATNSQAGCANVVENIQIGSQPLDVGTATSPPHFSWSHHPMDHMLPPPTYQLWLLASRAILCKALRTPPPTLANPIPTQQNLQE